MPIIIDGWNLIRDSSSDIDDTGRDSLDAARDLISRLKSFQRNHKDPILVVFDSTMGHLGLAHENSDLLSVRAAKDADLFIKRYVDDCPPRQRGNLRVVSSDKDVYLYARSSYATVLRSSEFWNKLRNKSGARPEALDKDGHY